LKAFGYTNFQIAWHYMKFVLVITMFGGLVGTFGGMWLAHDFTKLFLRVYQYPELVFRVRPNVIANAVLVAGGSALAGAFGAIAMAVRLPPAEAMRPEPPARYRPTILERIGLGPLVPNVARMVLRQLERHPVKSGFSILAISMSVAIIVVGNFMRNSVDEVIQTQFYDVQRYDLSLATVEAVSIDSVAELANMPGVERCEPRRYVAARLRAGNHARRVGILGLPPDASLMRLKTRTGKFVDLPREGEMALRLAMDQQNLGTIRPASADPAAIALAKALGQWPKPAASGRLSPKKTFDTAPATSVEAIAKELGKPEPCTVDAAFDCPHRAIADFGGFLVGETGRTNENQRLTLVRRQLQQGLAKFVELDVRGLLFARRETLGITAIRVLHLTPALAIFGPEMIAQDREEPRGHVGSGLKRVQMRPGTHQRLLDQIVGPVDVAAQRNGKRPQTRHCGEHRSAHVILSVHGFALTSRLACRDAGVARQTGLVRLH